MLDDGRSTERRNRAPSGDQWLVADVGNRDSRIAALCGRRDPDRNNGVGTEIGTADVVHAQGGLRMSAENSVVAEDVSRMEVPFAVGGTAESGSRTRPGGYLARKGPFRVLVTCGAAGETTWAAGDVIEATPRKASNEAGL